VQADYHGTHQGELPKEQAVAVDEAVAA